jgi:hypothetical protein
MITVDLKRRDGQRIIDLLTKQPTLTTADKDIINILRHALDAQPTPEQAIGHYQKWKAQKGL